MHSFPCWRVTPAYASVAQLVEHRPEEPGVTGSIPVGRTRQWGCSSVGRALAWHARGHGFDSRLLHHFTGYEGKWSKPPGSDPGERRFESDCPRHHSLARTMGSPSPQCTNKAGAARRSNALVAQLVEHRFEKPGVAGSTPAESTKSIPRGRSSAGRARHSHCRGRGFDSLRLHHPIHIQQRRRFKRGSLRSSYRRRFQRDADQRAVGSRNTSTPR